MVAGVNAKTNGYRRIGTGMNTNSEEQEIYTEVRY